MSVYEEFAGYLFETKAHIHYTESIDEFSVNFESSNANITDKYYVKGEKRGYYGYDLLKHALHNTVPDITKTGVAVQYPAPFFRETKLRAHEHKFKCGYIVR